MTARIIGISRSSQARMWPVSIPRSVSQTRPLAPKLTVSMNERLVEQTLRAFSDDLASAAAVPGGGSAAAYAGAMGAALTAMVGRIAEKKTKSEATSALIAEADNLRADFLRLVDDDSAAYARVAEAMKLPKATDEDKKAPAERLQAALLAASRRPLAIGKTCRPLLAPCERGVEGGTDSATVG